MPNIPPLITTMPDNQSLYVSYDTQVTPATQQYQNFACVPLACTGSGTLPPAAEVILFTKLVSYNFNAESFQRFFTAKAGFAYTAAAATGTIVFRFNVNGTPVQTITQTPSLSSQLVSFDQYIQMLSAATGSGAVEISVSAQSTDTNTITATSTQALYGAVLGCVYPA